MGQFDSCKRVTGKDGFFNMLSIHELTNIFYERICIIACVRIVRITMTASGEGKDVELVCKTGSKFVEDVSGSCHTGEKNQCGPFAAPIQIMEADSVHSYKV